MSEVCLCRTVFQIALLVLLLCFQVGEEKNQHCTFVPWIVVGSLWSIVLVLFIVIHQQNVSCLIQNKQTSL